MNRDLVDVLAYELHLSSGCPLERHARHVTDSDREHARVVCAALVPLLREKAQEWSSTDLMDAAAWVEGTL